LGIARPEQPANERGEYHDDRERDGEERQRDKRCDGKRNQCGMAEALPPDPDDGRMTIAITAGASPKNSDSTTVVSPKAT
jgi:hypothetical protein